jgi:hypothetical protein
VADQVSQKETVIAKETYSMSVAHVVDQVSQRGTVIATETCSTPVVFVVEIILLVQDVQFLLRVTTIQTL